MEATVVSRRNKRSYNIEIDGRHHIRNRRFLKPIIAPKEIAPKENTPEEITPKEIGPKENVSNETQSNKKKNKLHAKKHDLRPRHSGRRVTFRDWNSSVQAHPNLEVVM